MDKVTPIYEEVYVWECPECHHQGFDIEILKFVDKWTSESRVVCRKCGLFVEGTFTIKEDKDV